MWYWKLVARSCLGMAIAMLFGLAADARTEAPGSSPGAPVTEDLALGAARYTPYTVRPNDTLYAIAQRFDTTVAALQSLNGIGDRNHIVSGRKIFLPESVEVSVRGGFAYGITLFPHLENTAEILRQVKYLGVNWAKIEVRWADIAPSVTSFAFEGLDALVKGLDELGIRILLNVYAAPDWSRRSYIFKLNSRLRGNSGPPEDLRLFGDFMRVLANRYAGVVDMYEIWKSPNILKYWSVPVYEQQPAMDNDGDYGFPNKINIGAAYYVDLLKVAFEAVRAVDSDALVITAGLAPVGFTDNYNAVETRAFLQDMLHAGAADYSDGIGALFGASAVPPELFCCQQPPGVDTHYESYLQYFREVLYLYHDVLGSNQSHDIPIYITQVGWGTSAGANLAIPASGLEWLRYTDQDEQALYVRQALNLARGLDYISGAFLYNLNGCAVYDSEACFFSLVDAAAIDRPAFESFAAIKKTASS